MTIPAPDGAVTLRHLNSLAEHEVRIERDIRRLKQENDLLAKWRRGELLVIRIGADNTYVDKEVLADLNTAFEPYRSDISRIVEIKKQARIRELETQLRMIRDAVSRWFVAQPEGTE